MTRKKNRERGASLRKALGSAATSTTSRIPGFTDFMDEVIYSGIWDRPHLALVDRFVCALAAGSLMQRYAQIERDVAGALDAGLAPRSIVEVFVHVGLYGGFAGVEPSADAAFRVFSARGIKLAPEADRTSSLEELDRLGREVQVALHGDRADQGYAAPGNAITATLYPSAVRYGYGELWSRPGLDHRQRMLCAVAGFTALGLESQLAKFSQSALNIGMSKDEIVEAAIQTAPYGGFPKVLNALAILSKVL